MKDKLSEVTQLLYETAGGVPYNPPSYTCIREFTDSFAEHAQAKPEYTASPPAVQLEWQPQTPYPKIYTKNYKKSILSTT